MPRIRFIKHEFFIDDDLANQSHAARLLFIGLWTLADREGRLEDKPAKIKAQLFPYEQMDVDRMLSELADGFVTRYEVDGKAYIQINNFAKHQNPHYKEKPSTIPKHDSTLSQHQVNVKSTLSQSKRSLPSVSVILDSGERSLDSGHAVTSPSAPADAGKREVTPIQRVVNAYKVQKGVAITDKAWDKENYSRCSKPAKSLIECLGTWELAAAYVIGKGQEFDDKGLDWTLETIKKHAWDNRGKLGTTQATLDANPVLDGPRRSPKITHAGSQIQSAGQILGASSFSTPRADDSEICNAPFLAGEDVGG